MSDFIFNDLNHDLLASFQKLIDRGPSSGCSVWFEELRIDVGNRQKSVAVGTIIDKCSLKGRLDFDHLAKVDVS